MTTVSERNKTLALILGSGIVMLVIAAVGYVYVSGRDIQSFAPTLFGFAIPIVTTLLLAAGVSNSQAKIHEKVNGNYSKQQEIIEKQQQQINQFLAITKPEAAETILDSTGALPVLSPLSDELEGKHSK